VSSASSRFRPGGLASLPGQNANKGEVDIMPQEDTVSAKQFPVEPAHKSAKPPRRGPKTKAGRAAVSKNAIIHAIRSERPVLHGMESESEWRAHREGIVASLAPEGSLEDALAGRVALLLWRLNRVIRYEIAVTDAFVAKARSDLSVADAYAQGTIAEGIFPEPSWESVALAKLTRIIPHEGEVNLIMRYESHLHRQCIQTLHEIEALQSRRRGEEPRLVRLDINSLPSRLGGMANAARLTG